MKITKSGNFTGLAKDYSRNRPNYSHSVLDALLGLIAKEPQDITFADVGAGTGIWTRMVYERNLKSVYAVEPNLCMYKQAIQDSGNLDIVWINASAENTSLEDNFFDWITMASSFHWTDFTKTTRELHRALNKGGRFTALWNPRLIKNNPLLVDIEKYLEIIQPDISRISSGMSGITDSLTQKIEESHFFEDVIYIEGKHTIKMPPERYLGAWRSVNDLQVQLGRDKFSTFLNFVEKKIADVDEISATYLTRAWSARKK